MAHEQMAPRRGKYCFSRYIQLLEGSGKNVTWGPVNVNKHTLQIRLPGFSNSLTVMLPVLPTARAVVIPTSPFSQRAAERPLGRHSFRGDTYFFFPPHYHCPLTTRLWWPH